MLREWSFFGLDDRPTLAVSGFSYTFSLERPGGQRAATKDLSMDRQYRVACTEYIITQALDGIAGPGYLGWIPALDINGWTEIEAQLSYLEKQHPTPRLQN